MNENQSLFEVLKVEQNSIGIFHLPISGFKVLNKALSDRQLSQQKEEARCNSILTFKKHRRLMIVNNNVILGPDDDLYSVINAKLQRVSAATSYHVKQDKVLNVIKEILQDHLVTDTEEIHRKTIFNNKSNCKAVPARQKHSTKVVKQIEILACPLDRTDFSKPLYPSSERSTSRLIKESTPVQVTDNGIDMVDSFVIATNVTSGRQVHVTNLKCTASSVPVIAATPGSSLSADGYTPSLYGFRRETLHHNGISGIDETTCLPKPPRYPDYVLQVTRTSSFQSENWDVCSKPEVRTMVVFGFFYTGTGDLVRCYQCGIGLKDWVKDDDVMAEHIKYATDCDFLRQKLGKSEVERLKNALTSYDNTRTGNHNDQSTFSTYPILSPRYQTMEARIASFKSFPSIGIQHRTLAVAGLFYTGSGDLCRCFACDGGLKDWSTGDDPIQEHATYFPVCPYINQLKGADFVKKMQARRPSAAQVNTPVQGSSPRERNQSAIPAQNDSFAGVTNGHSSSSSAYSTQLFQQLGYTEQDVISAKIELEMKGITDPSSEDIVNTILDIKERAERQQLVTKTKNGKIGVQEMLEENQRLYEIVHCKLCVTGEPDILFLPCAHHKICHSCAENLTHCPICKKQIKQKVKTYRS